LIIGNLGTLGDPTAIPLLIAKLKDGSAVGTTEVWQSAQASLLKLTGCRLSPNGDKAARWWQAAQEFPPEAWRHFAIAQSIEAFLTLGPNEQEQISQELRKLTGGPSAPDIGFSWVIPASYRPKVCQEFWQDWLQKQTWTDYQALPSQLNEELVARAEPTAKVESGEPIHLRWTVTNVSPEEVRVCRVVTELAAIRHVNSGGAYAELGSGVRPQPTADDFILLKPEESFTFEGRGEVAHGTAPRDAQNPVPGYWGAHRVQRRGQTPAWVKPGLVLTHKGTAFGHDAWVGELWADPITLVSVEGAAAHD
jgi:hypothetical protein